ncbi:MAG: hypothetical protein RR283_07010 [Comamonas sp.]
MKPPRMGVLPVMMAATLLLSGPMARAESVSRAPTSVRPPAEAAAGKLFEGSRWALNYNAGEGERMYDVQLHGGGRMINTDPNDRTHDNDRWEAKGKYLILRFNDSYAVYLGTLQSDGSLKGQASNVVGDSWPWTGRPSRGDTTAR